MSTSPVIQNPDITLSIPPAPLSGTKADTSNAAAPGIDQDKFSTINPPTSSTVVPRGSVIDSDSHRIVDFGPEIGVVAIPHSLSDADANEFAQHVAQESKKYQQKGR
jgi:hypothetical protein